MLVFDSHLDLAWNAVNLNRDLTLPIEQIRVAERDSTDPHLGNSTVCFPEMRKGKVAICIATILARCTGFGEALLDYRTQEIAAAVGHGQRTYYSIMEECGHLRMLRDWPKMAEHVSDWKGGSTAPIGYVLAMEGADPILSPADATKWWNVGLRVVGLTHYGLGVYGHGTASPGGLTSRGFDLLNVFEELGMIVDVTHLMDEGFWQVIDKFEGPILASHNNCRALVPGDRQFSDEQIQALIARKAVIGVALDSWMLYPNYEFGKTDNSLVTMNRVIEHMDRICQIAGSAQHVAIGSDLDGGYGREQSPSDLVTIADVNQIAALLQARGYRPADIEGIMHANWLRFFRGAWSGPQPRGMRGPTSLSTEHKCSH